MLQSTYLKILVKSFLIYWFCSLCFQTDAQVFFQVERFNSTNRLKLVKGDRINFKTVEHPDTWRTEYIERIMPEENRVIVGGNFYGPEDFAAIRVNHSRFVKTLGPMLQTFGFSWFVFGGIAAAAFDYDFTGRDAVIGSIALISGTLLKMIFKRKKFVIGKNARIRILDLRIYDEIKP